MQTHFPDGAGRELGREAGGAVVEGGFSPLQGPIRALREGLGRAVQGLTYFQNPPGRFAQRGRLGQGAESRFRQIQPSAPGAGDAPGFLPQTGQNFHAVSSQNLRRGAGCGGAQIGGKISNGEINLVSDRAHHRDRRSGDGPGHDFLVEFPQVLDAAAAARHDQDIHGRKAVFFRRAEFPDGAGDFRRGAFALHADRIDEHFDPGMAAVQNIEEIPDGCAGRRGDQADAPGKARQRAFVFRIKESLGRQLALERLELGLQSPFAPLLHQPHDHLILAAGFVN